MNEKIKTLLLAVAVFVCTVIVSDSKNSIQQTLGLVTFILIFHFYLQRHYGDICDVMREVQSKVAKSFKANETSEYT